MDPTSILLLVAAAVAFFFLIIRPQRKRQQAQQQMQRSLQPGARIMTSAGIFGTVRGVTDDEISVEIAPGVVITIVPGAVSRVIPIEATPLDDTLGRENPPTEPPASGS